MLQAFNPYYAFDYLARNKYNGWRSLGGILLCFTGVEVLFAGIGAFSRQAIQVSWIGFVYPSLLLTYIGQAAFIAERPAAYADPFFNCAPPGWLIPSFIIAVCAAVVASQCIITATFHVSQIILGMPSMLTFLASGSAYEAILFPPDPGQTHIQDILWELLRSYRELVADDRHGSCRSNI